MLSVQEKITIQTVLNVVFMFASVMGAIVLRDSFYSVAAAIALSNVLFGIFVFGEVKDNGTEV